MALILLSLIGCATSGPGPDGYCLVARPIYFAPADKLTERTERAIITHNETWQQLCGK
jgi:predicted small lipoprotein YifL